MSSDCTIVDPSVSSGGFLQSVGQTGSVLALCLSNHRTLQLCHTGNVAADTALLPGSSAVVFFLIAESLHLIFLSVTVSSVRSRQDDPLQLVVHYMIY